MPEDRVANWATFTHFATSLFTSLLLTALAGELCLRLSIFRAGLGSTHERFGASDKVANARLEPDFSVELPQHLLGLRHVKLDKPTLKRGKRELINLNRTLERLLLFGFEDGYASESWVEELLTPLDKLVRQFKPDWRHQVCEYAARMTIFRDVASQYFRVFEGDGRVDTRQICAFCRRYRKLGTGVPADVLNGREG